MSRGNTIIVSPEAKGRFVEGQVGTGLTFYPGMVVQIDYTVALKSGRFTYKLYDADADGGRWKSPPVIVRENFLAGKTMDLSYAAAERFFGYIPQTGDELNLLIMNIAGTADDHTIGEVLIPDDTTGKWIATTGSPEIEPAVIQETLTDPTADTLAWCAWLGP